MKTIIYGAGEHCEDVLKNIREEVLCIADKDEKKIGKYLGYDVISPKDICNYDFDTIIVSVIRGYQNIREELISLNIDPGVIYHYPECISVSKRNTGTMKIDWEEKIPVNKIYDKLCVFADEDSDMEKFFLVGEHNRSFKWLHYFEVYNRHFKKMLKKDINIMEIGVQKGGSIQIWKKVFGPNAKIYGVDIQQCCKKFEDDQVKIFIGDQEDRNFWRKIKNTIPQVDIIIDDGGHYMEQQIVTFEEMFPHVKNGGVYICEDIGTSYNSDKYHAGYKKEGTFVEYSKNFIDYIHAWYAQGKELKINDYTRTMHSLHYYYGMLAIEKKEMYAPMDMEVCNTPDEKYAISHMRGNYE